MILPAQYVWFEPVAVAAIVVFFVSWIGNKITFSSPVLNALMTAIVFSVIFGAFAYFGVGTVTMTASKGGSMTATVPTAKGPPATTTSSEPKAKTGTSGASEATAK